MAGVEDKLAQLEAQAVAEKTTVDPIEAELEALNSGELTSAAPKIKRKTKNPDALSSIVGRSVDNLQANLGGTAEAAGEQLGWDALADAGGEFRDKQQAEAAKYGQPSIASYKQIEDLDDTLAFGKEMGVSSAPGMAAILGSGAAAAKVAPGALKFPAAVAGSLMASLGINIGDVQNQIKAIDPNQESTLGSVLAGGAISLLDVAGAGAIAKPLLKTLGKEVTEKLLIANGVKQSVAKEAVKGAALGGAAEAATGATQSVIGNVAAANATDTDLKAEQVVENAINAALGGSLVGTPLGAGAGAIGAASQNQLIEGTAPVEAPPSTEVPKNRGDWAKSFDALGSSSVKMLEPLTKVSSEAKKFVEQFRPDMTGKTASGQTIFEDAKTTSGKWQTKMDEIKSEIGGVKNFNKLLDDYQNNADPVTPEAKKFKALMDGIHTYAKTEGRLTDIGKIERFLPISADPTIVAAKRDEFIQDILPAYKGDVAAANKAVDEWMTKSAQQPDQVPNINRLVDVDAVTGELKIDPKAQYKGQEDTMKYKFSQGQIPPENSHLEKKRTFAKVPQAVLSKYAKEQTSKQRFDAVMDYIEGAAYRTAFSKRFGPRGERANAQIAKIVRQAQAAGYRPNKDEVTRMFDQLDAYNGMLNPIQRKGLKTAQSTASALLTVKTLPLAGFSTLVETMTPAIRGDIGSAMRAVVPTMKELAKGGVRRMFQGVPPTEFATMASEAGLSLTAATNVAAQRLGTNALTKGAAKLTTNFFLINGLTLMTHATRIYAAKAGEFVMNDALNTIAMGVPLNSAKGYKSLNMLRSMGVNIRSAEEARTLYSPTTPSEKALAREVKIQAMHRFASQSVLEPSSADTPMWMSDNRMHLVAMLHRYPSAFTNIILPQLARRMTPGWQGSNLAASSAAVGSLFIVGMMLSLGFVQDELKMIAKSGSLDYEDTRTDDQRFMDVLNQTIMPAQASWIMDFFNAPRYGSSGFGSIGPAIGFVEEAGKTIYSFKEDPKEGDIYKWMFKQTPAQFFRPGREAAGELDLL